MTRLETFVALFREDASHAHALTGIRGWAALWVFMYHAWGFSGARLITVRAGDLELDFTPLVSLGGAGVSIFFVLSGFLLGLPFAEWQTGLRDKPATGRYFVRRVARVFPAYYAQLAVLLILAALVPGHADIEDWPTLLRHLLMLFMPPPLGTIPINLVWWTLPIEFSFYLALPLLAFLLRPERWWWLLFGSLFAMWLWRHWGGYLDGRYPGSETSLRRLPVARCLRHVRSWHAGSTAARTPTTYAWLVVPT